MGSGMCVQHFQVDIKNKWELQKKNMLHICFAASEGTYKKHLKTNRKRLWQRQCEYGMHMKAKKIQKCKWMKTMEG